MSGAPTVRIGIIPLTDAAPIVAARELGLFERHGVRVELSPERSWATVRDKLVAGALDLAHLLAPMAIATSLGLGPVSEGIATGLSLGLGGNAITLSASLRRRLPPFGSDAAAAARALAEVVRGRRAAGARPLCFGTVFPYSMHEYELRWWLASAGLVPERDVQIRVVPPPRMVAALASGAVDGFCVGEPWSTAAVQRGVGDLVVAGHDLWPHAPEKVLGARIDWLERNGQTHRAVLRAVIEAARWCDAPENRGRLARWLSGWLGVTGTAVAPALAGRLVRAGGEPARHVPDFHCFHRYTAGFPWRSHAAWILAQMIRWGQIEKPLDVRACAADVYRCDLYREAAAELGVPVPQADEKIEGTHAKAWLAEGGAELGPDLFFDGSHFDPGRVVEHLAGCEVHDRRVALDELAAAQRNT